MTGVLGGYTTFSAFLARSRGCQRRGAIGLFGFYYLCWVRRGRCRPGLWQPRAGAPFTEPETRGANGSIGVLTAVIAGRSNPWRTLVGFSLGAVALRRRSWWRPCRCIAYVVGVGAFRPLQAAAVGKSPFCRRGLSGSGGVSLPFSVPGAAVGDGIGRPCTGRPGSRSGGARNVII